METRLTMAIRKTPTGPKPPPRAQVDAIIRRYLKPDQTPNWRQEFPLWYGLWKQYPSVAFWTRHELPFVLNSLAWFLTEQGQAQLASDYLTFHYTPPALAEVVLDSAPQPTYTEPYIPTPVRPRTVAEFLKS